MLYMKCDGTMYLVLNKLILLTKPSSISSLLYGKVFEKFVVTVNSKTLKNLWITKEILKSSKTKQRLCYKFFKSKNYEHEISYQNYRKLFESIKQRAKS